MRSRVLVVASLLVCSLAQGQEQKKIIEFSLQDVTKMTLDRLGDFYLIVKGGTIKKYDTEGNFMADFTNPDFQNVTTLEPWNPLRILVYSRDNQLIGLIDHHLELQEKIKVDSAWAIEPTLATTSIDKNIWVFDKSDASLKRINPETRSVAGELKVPGTSQDHDFIYVREYQNLIFLIDRKSGVIVLNSIGKEVHKINVPNVESIGFLGEEFYYLENGKLKFIDLYTEERREIAVDPAARFVMVTDERMIVVKPEKVEVLEFKP